MSSNACIGFLRGAVIPSLCWPGRGLHAEIARPPGTSRHFQRRVGWGPQWDGQEADWGGADWSEEDWGRAVAGEQLEGDSPDKQQTPSSDSNLAQATVR